MDDRLPLLQQLLDALPLGVVTLDRFGRVVHFNRAEERLAKRTRQRALGRDFFREIAPCMDVRELAGIFRDGIGREPLSVSIEFSFAFPFLDGPREVMVHMKSLDVRGVPYAALLIEDLNEQRASLRMQEMVADLLMQDLESPISRILANCGYLIQSAPELDGRALATVGEIARGADQLQGMLLNLLDVSRLETGGMPISLRRAPLLPVVNAAVTANRGHATRQGVALELSSDAPALEANIDPGLLGRMLDNLLENAIRHSPNGGVVRVRTTGWTDDRAAIEVVDEGPAVPPELRELVFEKFSRVQDGTARSDNRGLGLTFVKLATRAHGGEVTLTSDAGSGTVARIVLPNPEPLTDFMRIQEIDPSSSS